MSYYGDQFEPMPPKMPAKVEMAVLAGPTRSCHGWASVRTSKLSRPNRRFVVIRSSNLFIYSSENTRSHLLSAPVTGASLSFTSSRCECFFRSTSLRIWIQWSSENDLRRCKAAFEFANRQIDDCYKLVSHRQLGRGRNAEVVFAFDIHSGDHTAVKIINKDKAKSTDREFAEKEVCIRMTIQHFCIVQTLDVFESPFDLFIVMELMAGGCLDSKLAKQCRSLSEYEARIVMRRLFAALRYLHERNIVHRNVKPQNIYVDAPDNYRWPHTAKLSDFGLACILDDVDSSKQIVGTPEYLAPEASIMSTTHSGQRRVNFGTEVDMWAAGVTLYNLLSFRLPFEGDYPPDVFKKSRRGTFEFDTQAFSHVSQDALSLIRSLLNVDRRKRPTAQTVLLHPWFHFEHDSYDSDESKYEENNDILDGSLDLNSLYDGLGLSEGVLRLRKAAFAVVAMVRLRRCTPGVADRDCRRLDRRFQFNLSGINIAPLFRTSADGESDRPAMPPLMDKLDFRGRSISGTALSRVSTGSTVKSRSSVGTDGEYIGSAVGAAGGELLSAHAKESSPKCEDMGELKVMDSEHSTLRSSGSTCQSTLNVEPSGHIEGGGKGGRWRRRRG